MTIFFLDKDNELKTGNSNLTKKTEIFGITTRKIPKTNHHKQNATDSPTKFYFRENSIMTNFSLNHPPTINITVTEEMYHIQYMSLRKS